VRAPKPGHHRQSRHLGTSGSGSEPVGVANTTDFLRPHRAGRLQVVAVPVHQGRSQQLWQVEVRRREDGKLVARGQVRLQNVEAPS
jgi:1,4-dihydroxy-2-naphthoyl-CoA hydrolase